MEELKEKLAVRTGLREKLLHFYGQTFLDIYTILKTAEELDFLLLMHASSFAIGKAGDQPGVIIDLSIEPAYNSQKLVQEIFDDYLAAYLCFYNGFTKQAQEIIRNTLEETIQLYYLWYVKQALPIGDDSWGKRLRGIEKISDKLEFIKTLRIVKEGNYYPQLKANYNKLCTATHSHQIRLMSINMPRIVNAIDMPFFEPAEILYTKGIFLSTLQLELELLRNYFLYGNMSDWSSQIIDILSEMIEKVTKYKPTIDRFKKGYLVHNEYASISSDIQVLYSIDIDAEIKYPSKKKKKLTLQQTKELEKLIKQRLLTDTT